MGLNRTVDGDSGAGPGRGGMRGPDWRLRGSRRESAEDVAALASGNGQGREWLVKTRGWVGECLGAASTWTTIPILRAGRPLPRAAHPPRAVWAGLVGPLSLFLYFYFFFLFFHFCFLFIFSFTALYYDSKFCFDFKKFRFLFFSDFKILFKYLFLLRF
jgi:hypothetical protein